MQFHIQFWTNSMAFISYFLYVHYAYTGGPRIVLILGQRENVVLFENPYYLRTDLVLITWNWIWISNSTIVKSVLIESVLFEDPLIAMWFFDNFEYFFKIQYGFWFVSRIPLNYFSMFFTIWFSYYKTLPLVF